MELTEIINECKQQVTKYLKIYMVYVYNVND
jgi:hypothetical protein